MSATQTFAIDASQRLPNSDMHGEGDIVSIIELIIPMIIPLIAGCFEDQDQKTFGAATKELAIVADQSRWKQFRFRLGMLISLGREEFRNLPGGGRVFCETLIATAAQASAVSLEAVYQENACC